MRVKAGDTRLPRHGPTEQANMAFDYTPEHWQHLCFAVMALAVVMAVESDLTRRRVPNVVVLFTLVAGLLLNSLGRDNGGQGLFSYFPGPLGLLGALLGAVAGLLVFLPLYGVRAMGAGDVKFMAALGSFVGPAETVVLAMWILISGGLLALVRMVWARRSRVVLGNVMLVLSGLASGDTRRFDPATQSADRMPFALAFAAGLLAYGYWRLSGHGPLLRF
jgi:prepilin peptidase CpaA